MDSLILLLLPVPLFFTVSVILAIAFWTFDRLVKLEYQEYRNAWERDGKPSGMTWWPRESPWPQGAAVRGVLFFSWLFTTPDWIKQSSKGQALVKRLRACIISFNLGVIVLIIVGYLFAVQFSVR